MTRRLTRPEIFLWALVSGSACSSGGAAPDAGTSADAPGQETAIEAGALTRSAYCARIQAVCTGSNAQYSNLDDCLNSCRAFPVGQVHDEHVDSLACRITHLAMVAGND